MLPSLSCAVCVCALREGHVIYRIESRRNVKKCQEGSFCEIMTFDWLGQEPTLFSVKQKWAMILTDIRVNVGFCKVRETIAHCLDHGRWPSVTDQETCWTCKPKMRQLSETLMIRNGGGGSSLQDFRFQELRAWQNSSPGAKAFELGFSHI